MKQSDWDKEYNHIVRWAIRRMSDDCLSFYEDKREDWVTCLVWLDEFEHELINKHLMFAEELDMTASEWSKLCHKYISKAKKINNRTVGDFFFTIWTDCRFDFKNTSRRLNYYNDYVKPATEEEIKFAREHFSHVKEIDWHGEKREHTHTFSDDAKVLEYRKHRFIIDNEWNDAWYIRNDGSAGSFNLIWDWYYPIDTFIDLYEGWKK